MTDTEELRRALQAGTRLPGEVRPRPGAAALVRGRARRRQARRLAVVSAAGAGIVIAAVAVGLAGPRSPDTVIASPPATAPPSSSVAPTPGVSLPGGPRTFSAPVEIHPVRQEYLTVGCSNPRPAGTVPSAEGGSCYRLGTTVLTILRVRDLSAALATSPGGGPTAGTVLVFTLTPADSAAWSSLTASLVGKQVAFVVAGTVYSAPTIGSRITGGQFEIQLGPDTARQLLEKLGG